MNLSIGPLLYVINYFDRIGINGLDHISHAKLFFNEEFVMKIAEILI